MVIARANISDWFSSEGVARKRTQIENKGVPDMLKWRFTTLTMDPALFEYDPQIAYEKGKDNLRRFLYAIREYFGEDVRWCWKFEFQRNGWPHWHLCWDRTRKLSRGDLDILTHFWGMGRVDTRMIRDSSLSYLWKYVNKEACKSESGAIGAPDWFLDFEEILPSGRRKTYQRARFWQTSRNFYTKPSRPSPPTPPARSSMVQVSVRTYLEERDRKVRILAIGIGGEILKSATVYLKRPWKVVLGVLGRFCICGRAAGLDVGKYVCSDNVITKLTRAPWIQKVRKLIKVNQNPPIRMINLVHQMSLQRTPF